MALKITDTLEAMGSFPLIETTQIKGAPRVVADNTARDAIPSHLRIAGMEVKVTATGKKYELVGGIENTNWEEVVTGGEVDPAIVEQKVNAVVPAAVETVAENISAKYKNLTGVRNSWVGAGPDRVDTELNNNRMYPVTPGDEISIIHKAVAWSNVYTFLDSEDNFISYHRALEEENATIFKLDFVVPSGATRVLLTGGVNSIANSKVMVKLPIWGKTMPIWTQGSYVDADGVLGSDGNFKISAPIFLKKDQKITAYAQGSEETSIIAEVNADGTYTPLVVGYDGLYHRFEYVATEHCYVVVSTSIIEGAELFIADTLNREFTRMIDTTFVGAEQIVEPNDFVWKDSPLHGKVFKNSQGYLTTYDYKPTLGKCYYVHIIDGSDNNDGLSFANAFRSATKALSMPDVDTIIICSYMNRSMFPEVIDKSVNLIGYRVKDPVVVGNCINIPSDTWIKTEDASNVYQITYANAIKKVISRIEYDSNGYYLEYAKKTSIAEVDATDKSYFIDGNTVYVRQGTAAPIRIFIVEEEAAAVNIAGEGVRVFMQNIDAIGVNVINGATAILKNCKSQHAIRGIRGNNGATVISIKSEACKNNGDGFTYSSGTKFIEIGCKGFDNGEVDATTNNGTTSHDNCLGIRINGDYQRNYGPNFVDVRAGCQTWNLGCNAADSKSEFPIDYQCQGQNGEPEMWLDGCTSTPATGGVDSTYTAKADGGGTIYYRDTNFKKVDNYIDGGSNILPY